MCSHPPLLQPLHGLQGQPLTPKMHAWGPKSATPAPARAVPPHTTVLQVCSKPGGVGGGGVGGGSTPRPWQEGVTSCPVLRQGPHVCRFTVVVFSQGIGGCCSVAGDLMYTYSRPCQKVSYQSCSPCLPGRKFHHYKACTYVCWRTLDHHHDIMASSRSKLSSWHSLIGARRRDAAPTPQ